jgi:hypothetical protein
MRDCIRVLSLTQRNKHLHPGTLRLSIGSPQFARHHHLLTQSRG